VKIVNNIFVILEYQPCEFCLEAEFPSGSLPFNIDRTLAIIFTQGYSGFLSMDCNGIDE